MAPEVEKENKLTEYESRQVAKIAAWKAEFPNPFGELFRRVAQPVASAAELVIPDSIARAAINAVYKASDVTATQGDIKRQAGVGYITELRQKPLEVCDRLSRRVGTLAQGVAVVEGAATGAGGVWTTLVDIPLLFTLCLRTIIKTGHCYGYPLDRPSDKAWVVGAFVVALSSTKEQRTERMAKLREIEDLVLEETQEQVVLEETASLLTQLEVFEDIPVFGAATGALLNLWQAHKADVTARHLFQERWLRDNGKVDGIEPAQVHANIPAMGGWYGTLARAGYGSVYSLSFATVFPVSLVTTAIAPITGPLFSSIRNNAAVAMGGAEKMLGGRRRQLTTQQPTGDGHAELAPA